MEASQPTFFFFLTKENKPAHRSFAELYIYIYIYIYAYLKVSFNGVQAVKFVSLSIFLALAFHIVFWSPTYRYSKL